MSKSLFRYVDRLELLSCYMLCFAFNIIFDFVKTVSIDSHLMEIFLMQLYNYQKYIILFLSIIVVIFHYQVLRKKKVEVYCRFIVGDTVQAIITRYVLECLMMLGIVFFLSLIVNIILNIHLENSIYLFCIFVIYILISSREVRKFENL